ncbi:MAG: glycosyltransferase [Alphaproteobacteria bacterium]|nr:glycosyltransferase [Alphaproteobacteria bacterium]
MQNNALLSVIIPVHNVEKYLEQCLTSVVNQTYENLEIICVNDGSTDNSMAILESYAANDKRIKIINQQNRGLSLARNAGIEKASGELIAFLDSDDWLELDFYEKLINRLQKDNSDIAIGETYYKYPHYTGKNEWVNMFNFKKDTDVIDTIFDKQNLIYSCACWNKVYRSSLIQDNNIRFPAGLLIEDVPFTFAAIINARKISLVRGAILNYRRAGGTIMDKAHANRTPFFIFDVYKICDDELKNMNLDKQSFLLYKDILDHFKIFNIFNWSKATHDTFKKEFFAKMKKIFKGIKLKNNRFVTPDSKLIHRAVVKSSDYKTAMERVNNPDKSSNKLSQKIFSIKNKIKNNRKYKVITLLGMSMKIRVKNKPCVPDCIMDIFFATDDKFAEYLSVAMASILATARPKDYHRFYILDGGVSEANKKHIANLKKIKDFYLEYIKVDDDLFKDCPMTKECAHISRQTYYRYIIAKVKPDLDKALYLDGDIICKSSLSEFWNINIDNYYAAAVEGLSTATPSIAKRLGTQTSFNAGVLLINLKKWKEDNIPAKLFANTALLANQNKLVWQDQDVLNYTFKDCVLFVSPRFNLQYNAFVDTYCHQYSFDEIEAAKKNPVIIHYNSPQKPWNEECAHPLWKEYYKYLKLTPYKKDYYKWYFKRKTKKLAKGFFSVSDKKTGLKHYKIYKILGVKVKRRNFKREYEELFNMYGNVRKKIENLQTSIEFSTSKQETLIAKKFYFDNTPIDCPKANGDNFTLFYYKFISIFHRYGVNLGDYIQTQAVMNLVKQIAPSAKINFWDRDSLSFYNGEPSVAIMQGWFAHDYNFIPNNKITPVWIGTHITPCMKHFVGQFVNYNPQYFAGKTIGCRDKDTLDFFRGLGIDAYSSRCLTLTLPKRKVTDNCKEVFIVDLPERYYQYIPQELMKNARIIKQRCIDGKQAYRSYFNSGDKYLKSAGDLLQKYADEARLIITTALHCASPCTAMGIPVVLIDLEEKNTRFSALDGIIKIYSVNDLKNGKVDFNCSAPDIEKLKSDLISNVKLTLAQEQGMEVDKQELERIRNNIAEFRAY